VTDQDQNEQCRQIMKHFNAWIEPVDADERRSLGLFCDLVNELERDPLFEELLQHGEVNWNYTEVDGKITSSHIENLNDRNLGAFVALARLFTQKKERASIRHVARIFEKRVGDRHPISWTFNAHRLSLNNFLSMTAPELSDTFGQLFDVFVYGHYTHREDAKETQYELWKKDARGFTARKACFVLAIGTIFHHAQEMRNCARQLLKVVVEDLCWRPPTKLPVRRFEDGISHPMFAHDVVSLDPAIVARVTKGERVLLTESVIPHVRNFLDEEVGDHISADCMGEIDVHEYGSKLEDRWLEKHLGASIALPVSWETSEKLRARGRAVVHHVGKPSLFLTGAFFSHLKFVGAASYKWELHLRADRA
jgi:hypothetical protein